MIAQWVGEATEGCWAQHGGIEVGSGGQVGNWGIGGGRESWLIDC